MIKFSIKQHISKSESFFDLKPPLISLQSEVTINQKAQVFGRLLGDYAIRWPVIYWPLPPANWSWLQYIPESIKLPRVSSTMLHRPWSCWWYLIYSSRTSRAPPSTAFCIRLSGEKKIHMIINGRLHNNCGILCFCRVNWYIWVKYDVKSNC